MDAWDERREGEGGVRVYLRRARAGCMAGCRLYTNTEEHEEKKFTTKDRHSQGPPVKVAVWLAVCCVYIINR